MARARYYYDKRQKDFIMKWDEGCKQAAVIFHNAFYGERCCPDFDPLGRGYKFEESFRAILEKSGYDITTLKVSIEKKVIPASSSATDPH